MSVSNKTDRYLILLQKICKAPGLKISANEFKDIMGHTNDKTYHRDVAILCNDSGERKAILTKLKDNDGNITFQLNQSDWYSYLEGTLELQFLLKAYKEMGYLFPNIEAEGIENDIKNLDRKFIYHSTVKAKNAHEKHIVTEIIMKALIGNKKLFITYNGQFASIYPLTLCQYRDELYLFAYKNEIHPDQLRKYKISRIEKTEESNELFRYPLKNKWDPKEYLKNSSGIVVNKVQSAIFRVYGLSRGIIIDKHFMNSTLVTSTSEYDEYECNYTNIEEFVGSLFIYGQDIEIVSDQKLKNFFVEKAQSIISRNTNSKKIA